MGWLDFIKKQPVSSQLETIDEYNTAEKDFWEDLLGELLLDEQAKTLEEEEIEANAKAAGDYPNIDERNAALNTLNEKKSWTATFANEQRTKAVQDFTKELKDYKNNDIEALQQKYTDQYNKALKRNAIQTIANINEGSEAQAYKDEYFRRIKLAHCTASIKCTGTCNCESTNNVIEIIKKEQEAKLEKMNRDWWAIWVGLKNSKYFSLSCGTTMGGALIIIAIIGGPIAVYIATIVAIPVVYWVTRADWWLTNQFLPKLSLALANFSEFRKNFAKKLYNKPLATSFNVIITFVVTIVWAALTYDTTYKLTTELYKQFGFLTDEVASLAMLSITGGLAIWNLMEGVFGKKKMSWMDIIWTGALMLGTAGIGWWVFGPQSSAGFQYISSLTITIFMTIFTAPAVYTVFNLYTDRFMKALDGAIDKETGEDNVYHPKNVNKSLLSVIDDANANDDTKKAFNKTYRNIMGIGAVVGLGASLVLGEFVLMALDSFGWVKNDISLSSLADYQNGALYGAMFGSMLAVTVITSLVFKYIDQKYSANQATNKATDDPNVAMLYKSLFVLGTAGLIGTLGIVMASQDIMSQMFEASPRLSGSADILNAVFTVGIGFLGAAFFYSGSAINTVSNLFKTTDDNPDYADPTGVKRQPVFLNAIYENKSNSGKFSYFIGDLLDPFGTDPSKKEKFSTILINGIANCFQTFMSAVTTGMAVLFSTSAATASTSANWGVETTTPTPLPPVEQEKEKVKMLNLVLFSNTTAIKSDSKKSSLHNNLNK
jgi:hypothetical protein